MAQRTAFLNSDASGYNKDFHHTWILNYLLKQVGVMFSDYSTKPEFALGDGQIAAGSAIVKCTRTSGTFAGKEVLAIFESTAVETINTTGNKKVFIEIPETYVNDSSTITDTLTQGVNLGVGIIKSESSYPSHSNYIPLWEITGGDWAGALDVRPEVLRAGQPNTISYFDNNGKEQQLNLDASSLNKFLRSNGSGIAPSWADVTSTVEVQSLKKTFVAGETLLAKSMFRMEQRLVEADALTGLNLGYDSDSQKRQLNTILNGEDFDAIYLNLENYNSAADDVDVRIESVDASGNATGSLIDVNAYGTVSPGGSMGEVEVLLAGTITGQTSGTKVAIVLERSGGLSSSNYYKVGVKLDSTGIRYSKSYNGSSWTVDVGYKGYVMSDGFMNEAAIQSKAINEFLADSYGYTEFGATAGNEFTSTFTGMIDRTGVDGGEILYLSDTGVLSTTPGTITKEIATGVYKDVAQLNSGSGISGGSDIYDAVIEPSDGADALNNALNAGKRRILIKPGTYALDTGFILSAGEGLTLHGDGTGDVRLDLSYYGELDCTSSNVRIFRFDFGSSWDWVTSSGAFVEPIINFEMKNLEIVGLVRSSSTFYYVSLFEKIDNISPSRSFVGSKFNIDISNFKFGLTFKQSEANGVGAFYLESTASEATYIGGGFYNCDFKFEGAETDTVERIVISGDRMKNDSLSSAISPLFDNCTWTILSNRESATDGYVTLNLKGQEGFTALKRKCRIYVRGPNFSPFGGPAISFGYDRNTLNIVNIEDSSVKVQENPALCNISNARNCSFDNPDPIYLTPISSIPDDLPSRTASTSYVVGDIVEESEGLYYCLTNHTSSSDFLNDMYTLQYRELIPYNFNLSGDIVNCSFGAKGLIIFNGKGGSFAQSFFCQNKVADVQRFIVFGNSARIESNFFRSVGLSDIKHLIYGKYVKYISNSSYVYLGGSTLKTLFRGDYYMATSNTLHKDSTSGDAPAIEEIGTPTGGVSANNILHEGT